MKTRLIKFIHVSILCLPLTLSGQQSIIDSLTKELQQTNEVHAPVIYNQIAALQVSSLPDEAIKNADRALALSQKYKNHAETGKALYNKASAFYYKQKYSEAANYAVDAIKSFTLATDDDNVAATYLLLGNICREKNEFDHATLYINNALNQYKAKNDSLSVSKAFQMLASVFHRQYRYQEAIDAYQQALSYVKNSKDKQYISSLLNSMALIYRDKGDNEKALQKLSESLFLLDPAMYNKERAEVLNLIGSIYFKMRQYDQALEYYLKSADIRKELNMEEELAAVYINIGLVYREKNLHQQALEYYQQALDIRKKSGTPESVMTTLGYLGGYYLNLRMYSEALRHYLDQLKISLTYNNKKEMAGALANIATINMEQKNYRKAIDYLEYALKINLELKDYNKLGANYVLLGNVYLNMKDYMTALQCYEESLEYRRKLGDETQIAATLVNIGLAYQHWGKYKKAWEAFSRSSEIRHKIKDYAGLSVTYNHLGNLYLEKKDTSEALKHFRQSLRYAKLSGNTYQWALGSRKIGEIYLAYQQADSAYPFLQQSLSLGIDLHHLELQRRAYFALHQYYLQKNDYKKALTYYSNYAIISDSIYQRITNQYLQEKQMEADLNFKDSKIKDFESEIENLRAEDRIKAIELKRQQNIIYFISVVAFLLVVIGLVILRGYRYKHQLNEELEKHIADIQRANELLRKSEEELKILNSTKDKLFSIIAHDLRNALNGILNLTQMLINEQIGDYNEKKEVFVLINESAQQLHTLLTNLLDWSRSQTGKITYRPEVFDLYELADKNKKLLHLNANAKHITLANRVMPQTFVYADREMINTVLRNLISNAIKFTPENGLIVIQAIIRDTDVLVSVEDNGVGISEENQKNLFRIDKSFTTRGTNMEPGTGLGLILCRELVEKNKGEIWVESELGKGSRFYFTLPRTMIPEKSTVPHEQENL